MLLLLQWTCAIVGASYFKLVDGQFDFSSWLESGTDDTESEDKPSPNSCKWEDPPEHGYSFRPCATGICKDVPGAYKKNGTVRFTGCEKHFVLTRGSDKDTCDSGQWSSSGQKCTECGRSQGRFNPNEEIVLIHHGRNSSRGDFPWMAALFTPLDAGRWENICGGTLISSRLVLSAAHCLTLSGAKLTAERIQVGLGKIVSSFYFKEPSSVILTVSEIIKPERYVGSDHLFDLDIALLVLSQNVYMNAHIMPACIDWRAVTPPQPDETGYLAGYGINEKGVQSSSLKWAFQKFKDYDTCRSLISVHDKKYVTHDKFCVAQVQDSKADKGDSGGGLTFVREGVHYLYGVVSTKLYWDDKSNIRLFTSLLNDEHRAWLRRYWYKSNANGSECVTNSDCESNRSCDFGTCVDPCLSLYCANHDCRVSQHLAKCACETTRTCSKQEKNSTAEVQTFPPTYEQVPGDICRQVEDDLWACKSLSNCPKAVVAVRNGTKPYMCNYKDDSDKNPLVCCEPYLKRPPRESTSKRMCRLFSQTAKQEDASCAVHEESLDHGERRKLRMGELTYMAYTTGDNFQTHCISSLISDRFLITTALCSVTKGPMKKARLGVNSLEEILFIDRDAIHRSGQDYGVIATIVHPEYKQDNRFNSIALVKLESSVEFNSLVRPICLHPLHIFPETRVVLTGVNLKTGESYLEGMTITTQKECSYKYFDNDNKPIGDEALVCAKDYNGDANKHNGFILQVKLNKPYCMNGLVGVNSFILPNRTDVQGFTRISHYLPWIENIVWPH